MQVVWVIPHGSSSTRATLVNKGSPTRLSKFKPHGAIRIWYSREARSGGCHPPRCGTESVYIHWYRQLWGLLDFWLRICSSVSLCDGCHIADPLRASENYNPHQFCHQWAFKFGDRVWLYIQASGLRKMRIRSTPSTTYSLAGKPPTRCIESVFAIRLSRPNTSSWASCARTSWQ